MTLTFKSAVRLYISVYILFDQRLLDSLDLKVTGTLRDCRSNPRDLPVHPDKWSLYQLLTNSGSGGKSACAGESHLGLRPIKLLLSCR